jgi:hypothetical protein
MVPRPHRQESSMIDHIGFPVSDYQRSKAFYLKALAPLDYSLVMEVTQEQTGLILRLVSAPMASRISGSAARAASKSRCMWRSWPGIAPPSTRSTRLRSQPADVTTARPASARIIIPITTARSCLIPTATTSRRSVTSRREFHFPGRERRRAPDVVARCRSSLPKSHRQRRARQPSHRREFRQAIRTRRRRRPCTSPASHRVLTSFRARCPKRFRDAGRTGR